MVQSGNDLRTEIKRYEEIAAAKLNRMVQTEIKMGTLLPPGRRMKRYSRFTKPKEVRRVAGACVHTGVRAREGSAAGIRAGAPCCSPDCS